MTRIEKLNYQYQEYKQNCIDLQTRISLDISEYLQEKGVAHLKVWTDVFGSNFSVKVVLSEDGITRDTRYIFNGKQGKLEIYHDSFLPYEKELIAIVERAFNARFI